MMLSLRIEPARHKLCWTAAGRIVLQLQVIANKSLVHPQANYVVAKVLDHGDAMDVMIITEPIFTDPYRLLTPDVKNSKFAIIKTVKAVDTLASHNSHHVMTPNHCYVHLQGRGSWI